jgi:hypothetical protein
MKARRILHRIGFIDFEVRRPDKKGSEPGFRGLLTRPWFIHVSCTRFPMARSSQLSGWTGWPRKTRRFLGVPDDPDIHGMKISYEVDSWILVLQGGTQPYTMATGFITSQEDSTDLVLADYEAFLGRPPTGPAEVDFWLGLLTRSTDPKTSLIMGSGPRSLRSSAGTLEGVRETRSLFPGAGSASRAGRRRSRRRPSDPEGRCPRP